MSKLLLSIFFLFAISFSACSDNDKLELPTDSEQAEGNEDSDEDESEQPPFSGTGRYLILYASRSGTTERVAQLIQSTLNCDILEVEPTSPYESDYNAMLTRAQNELRDIENGIFPSIKTSVESFENYDMIFVGYPIWHGHMATPMQSFLNLHSAKLSGKNIALFATSGSSGMSTSLTEAQKYCTNSTFIETLHLTSSTIPDMQNRVTNWLLSIGVVEENQNTESMDIKLTFNDHTLTATLVDNSSTKALMEILAERDIIIEMEDYANMEKVGPFGFSLPRNDEQITTTEGDLILYQGNSFVVYYAPNTWSFTRLGKINNIAQGELKTMLGSGNVTMRLSRK